MQVSKSALGSIGMTLQVFVTLLETIEHCEDRYITMVFFPTKSKTSWKSSWQSHHGGVTGEYHDIQQQH
jgi:hypothetical protein